MATASAFAQPCFTVILYLLIELIVGFLLLTLRATILVDAHPGTLVRLDGIKVSYFSALSAW
jgi:hypothetical protein